MPFFGICLGLQMHGHRVRPQRLRHARTPPPPSSTPERDSPVIYKLRDLLEVEELGGTMRLGAYPCQAAGHGTLAARSTAPPRSASGTATVARSIRRVLPTSGRAWPACSRASRRTASSSRWSSCRTTPGSWAASSTPEYKSKPTEPHPLFVSYIAAALKAQKERGQSEARELIPAGLSRLEGPPSTSEPAVREEVPSEVPLEG